jgi:hypothetical protein
MFIFAILNFICLSIILAKFIWHSENSRRETARYINNLFGVPKTELELIAEEQDAEELNHTCEQCNDGLEEEEDNEEDDNEEEDNEEEADVDLTDNSMPPLVETQTKAEAEAEAEAEDESKGEESDDVSIEHVNAEDLETIKETLGFIQKTKEMLFEIKNDLEKKID